MTKESASYLADLMWKNSDNAGKFEAVLAASGLSVNDGIAIGCHLVAAGIAQIVERRPDQSAEGLQAVAGLMIAGAVRINLGAAEMEEKMPARVQ